MEGVVINLRALFEHGSAKKRPTHKLCEVCGQTFDTWDTNEIFHHGPEPHAPFKSGAQAPPRPS